MHAQFIMVFYPFEFNNIDGRLIQKNVMMSFAYNNLYKPAEKPNK